MREEGFYWCGQQGYYGDYFIISRTNVVGCTASDTQLEDALASLGFGDDSNLLHYGRNFRIGELEETSGCDVSAEFENENFNFKTK